MAARVRSDCRIVRAGGGIPSHGSGPVRQDRGRLPEGRRNGRVGRHLKSAREGHITVALTGRDRRQLNRLRGMSTRIRALVHEKEVDASPVTLLG